MAESYESMTRELVGSHPKIWHKIVFNTNYEFNVAPNKFAPTSCIKNANIYNEGKKCII